mgnify:CR=1 FL=1
MDILKMKDMKGGWFIGNFEPTAFKTEEFEVCYKHHTKGEQWETHYHKEGTEINYLVEGKMTIQNKKLNYEFKRISFINLHRRVENGAYQEISSRR